MLLSRSILANLTAAMQNNQSLAVITINNTQSKLLILLNKQGFIRSFEKRGKYTIVYFPKIYRNKWSLLEKSFNEIKVPMRLRNNSSIKSKNWTKINKLQGNAIYTIISTDKGLLDSLTSIKSGGIPLISVK